jgi:uncharacterized membrane protein
MNTSMTIRIYLLITFLVILWCAGIIAAPLLMHAGYDGSADIVYAVFSRICHQNEMHSFHVDGEKMGVCMRCSAIYFGFLAGLLIMPFSGALKRMRTPNSKLILAVMIPMLVDVLLNAAGLHRSTTLTRVATGLFFGGVMPWCIVPLLVEACSQFINKKKNHSPDSGVYTYVRKTQ